MTVVSWYMYPTRTINIHINPSYISSSSQLSSLIHLLYLLSPINPHSYLKIIFNPPSIFLGWWVVPFSFGTVPFWRSTEDLFGPEELPGRHGDPAQGLPRLRQSWRVPGVARGHTERRRRGRREWWWKAVKGRWNGKWLGSSAGNGEL